MNLEERNKDKLYLDLPINRIKKDNVTIVKSKFITNYKNFL